MDGQQGKSRGLLRAGLFLALAGCAVFCGLWIIRGSENARLKEALRTAEQAAAESIRRLETETAGAVSQAAAAAAAAGEMEARLSGELRRAADGEKRLREELDAMVERLAQATVSSERFRAGVEEDRRLAAAEQKRLAADLAAAGAENAALRSAAAETKQEMHTLQGMVQVAAERIAGLENQTARLRQEAAQTAARLERERSVSEANARRQLARADELSSQAAAAREEAGRAETARRRAERRAARAAAARDAGLAALARYGAAPAASSEQAPPPPEPAAGVSQAADHSAPIAPAHSSVPEIPAVPESVTAEASAGCPGAAPEIRIVAKTGGGEILLVNIGSRQRARAGMKFGVFRREDGRCETAGFVVLTRILDDFALAAPAASEPGTLPPPAAAFREGDFLENPFFDSGRSLVFAAAPGLASDVRVYFAVQTLGGVFRTSTGAGEEKIDFLLTNSADPAPAGGPRRVTVQELLQYAE